MARLGTLLVVLLLAGCSGQFRMGMFDEKDVKGAHVSYCMTVAEREGCAGIHAGLKKEAADEPEPAE